MRTITESIIILASFFVNQLLYRKKLPPPSRIKKILVVKLDHIGDVLLATPVITNLRRHYPHAHITLLIGSWSKQVVECNPHLDDIRYYDSPFFCRSSRAATLKDAMQMLRWLKSERYDLIVELRGDFLTLALAMLKSGKYRLDRSTQRVLKKLRAVLKEEKGGREGKEGRKGMQREILSDLATLRLCVKKLKESKENSEPAHSEHEVEINLDVLRAGDIPITSRETFFNVPSETQTWTRGFFSEIGIDTSKPIVAIHPGSPVPLKRWPAERFAKLADILIERKTQVLFLGGTNEKRLVEEVQAQMHHNSVNIAGRTNLQQLGAVLQNCHLFIGNDSGPMHIAAAVGTRVIGLFGPGSPQRFGPFGDNCTAIRQKLDCPPCMKEKCSLHGRPGEEGCIVEISVEDVLDTLSAFGKF
ncbi:glycosyltransferase family 9 protein [Candidatus Poribacteria bacterium]|nr:glycosyltransferase family 9 protein [Candidatus Poribacteria bacterium]